MIRTLLYKVQRITAALLLLLVSVVASAQTDTIRYVKTDGEYTHNGRSWATAKNNLQDAINDLRQYLNDYNLKSGSIYVAAGEYKPSESTESDGGGLQYTAFKIYPGIHVYGGFPADITTDNCDPFETEQTAHGINYKYRPLVDNLVSLESGQEAKKQPWNFINKTILSGSHNTEPTFEYDDTRGTYNITFPGNSYHVVWFATEGFIPGDADKHALPLPADMPASIDGCTIHGGNANNKNTNEREHTSFGGGAYMVAGASLTRCVVDHCAAALRGGGIYLDGGGLVDNCMIHTCQSPGVGIMQGYGGGVCIDYDGAVTRSYIVNNSARLGGGLSICHAPDEYPWEKLDEWRVTNGGTARGEINVYSPHSTACIVSNNSATAESGGVYLYDGGVINHLTITRNKCTSADVSYYGRRHGRSGGVYILNGGQMYNSVVWGNKCPANNDIQYAAHTSGSTDDVVDQATGNVTREGLKPKVYYSAIDRHDITDWVGTYKFNVYSLEDTNTNEARNNANYPYFIGTDGHGTMDNYAGAGYNPDNIPRPIYWKLAAITSLAEKGVQVTSSLSVNSEWIRHAHTETDLFGDIFRPKSSLGALIRRDEQFGCAMIANQEIALYQDNGYSQSSVSSYTNALNSSSSFLANLMPDDGTEATLPTIFVDPARNAGQKGITIGEEGIGASWDKPIGHINDAIYFFKNHIKRDSNGNIVYDANGDVRYVLNVDGNGDQEYKHVQILVKGVNVGSPIIANTSGIGAYLGEELRSAAIRPSSNMRLYGGYNPALETTATNNRDQRTFPTSITADVTNSGYINNTAHVFALINVRNVIIDGFRLYYGNANLSTTESYAPEDPVTHEKEPITYGGGIIVNNVTVPSDERISMTGNILRNSVIANCSAPDGAAVYVNSSNPDNNGNYHEAELNILNTIIRNNTIGTGQNDITDPRFGNAGVITAKGGLAKIRLDHCDIVNNCGYALETTQDNNNGEGNIRIYNSIIYVNGKTDYTNRKNIAQPLCYRSAGGNANNIGGDYIYIDWDAPTPSSFTNCQAVFCRDFSAEYKKYAIRKVDSSNNTIIEDGVSPKFFDSEAEAQAYIASQSGTWTSPILLDYPYFTNPSRNVGHSEEGDKPMNGGQINYTPNNMNPMVNAAIAESRNLWDYDNHSRTYGGDPDIGAIECTTLPKAGTVIYVTPNGAGKRDGSSWGNAIQGNAIYALTGAAAGSDVLDAQNGARITNTDPAVGTLPGNGVPTTDNRYSGGFGRVWLTDWKTGGSTNTTITQTWLTEKNIYDDGARMGEEEILHDGSTYTEETDIQTTSAGTTAPGFTTAGYYNDPNFPYGEISGASRSFWRANPYHSGSDWNNAASYANLAAFIEACNTNGWINNSRAENYVGGLQYAVEKAAAYNALDASDPQRMDGVDSVQVWVGNGTYTDYKGFVMRDNTTVMGSFPVDAVGTPGLTERQALMSAVVDIPKSMPAQNLEATDYETILQISDTDPKQDNDHLNTNAVKFWDDDYSLLDRSDNKTTEYKNRNLIHHFKWGTTEGSEATSDYLTYPTFNVSFTPTPTDEGGYRSYTFGAEVTGKDRWHLKHPIKDNYVVNIENSNNNKNKQRTIYDPTTNQKLKDGNSDVYFKGNWIFLGNGSMTGTEFWQTMPNVQAGKYRLYVDMAGGYRNKFSSQDPTNIFFKIIAADGTTDLITPVMLKTLGSYNNSDDTGNSRNMAYRYALDFTQLATGDVTIKIVVEDGVRNTSANGASDPTSTGGDPDPIPCSYRYDGANCSGNQWGSNNPNRREFWMSNLHLFPITEGYEEDMASLEDQQTTRQASETINETGTLYNSVTHRTTLRKRVLTMPDVCVPTYGAGSVGDPTATDRGKLLDNLSHTDRVKKDSRTSTTLTKHTDPNYVEYNDVIWDGFTIRHGFISEEAMAHGGGAGVNMYEGASLRNCIITNNITCCERVKGAGIFCDGSNSTIEGSFVLNNTATHGKIASDADQKQVFAGGMFMYEGTCFNSLFANNYSHGSAGGVGFCVGKFFNNTIAYNTCALVEGGHINGGAISIATSSNPNLFIANTIVYGNTGMAIRERYDANININAVNPFINCYVQTAVAFTQNIYKKNIGNHSDNNANYGIGNVLLDGVAPSAENTPFEADLENGTYTGNASTYNDFRLTNSNPNCINKGTEAFAATLYNALRFKGQTDANIRNSFIYKSVESSELPANDVAFADRIQDCQIDMGAYEYDGTQEIKPGYEMISFDTENPDNRELCVVYYVGNQGIGLATGDSPQNMACASKLQKILDAAGRLKADLSLGTRTYSTSSVQITGDVQPTYEAIYDNGTKVKKVNYGVSVANNGTESGTATPVNLSEVKHVIVKLTGGTTFYPQRTTDHKVLAGHAEEVILQRSIMIPHGVEVMGGYIYENDNTKDFLESTRDPLNNKTTISGQVVNAQTGASGNAYHVIQFTNSIYSVQQTVVEDAAEQTTALTNLADRAVIDGVSIEGGYANGTSDEDKVGAACIVTKFSHVRNCIIQDNQSINNGGGLYMEPGALVSGCVLLNNQAQLGGAIYATEPSSDDLNNWANRDDAYARIYNTTIVHNNADTRGGGIWFETNLRAKGVVMWANTSNDMNNVAGAFDSGQEQTEANYPFAYSAVQARRLPGVNNIEVKAQADEGVRWTTNSNDDMRWRGDKQTYTSQTNKDAYYYIQKISALVRSGMPYQLYKDLRAKFPTLEMRDMAGVARMDEFFDGTNYDQLQTITFTPTKKSNQFIEIGARALDADIGFNINNRVFTRLFVTTPDQVNSSVASTLLECEDPLYSQQGSSMANPFMKLTDALDYIVAQRNRTDKPEGETTKTWGDIYADTRFEIFISGGTYYPYHNARGVEGHARSSTYVVPEGVSIIGGINPSEFYCQAGYNFAINQPMAGDNRLNKETGVNSNDRSDFYDANGTQLILSGLTLKTATITDDIMESREREDINGNNVFEPWEFAQATTLSGHTPRGEENVGNVYHVISCFADPEHTGTLPGRYKSHSNTDPYNQFSNPATDDADAANETQNSILQRTIIINGVNITNGNARDYESNSINNIQQFYRGGGIMVDGNWRNANLDSGKEYDVTNPAFDINTNPITKDITGYTNDPDAVGLRDIPLVVANTQFQGNNAIQGGAIFTNGTLYVFGCSFVQNYAQGPIESNTQSDADKETARDVIQYNGGGAIATNSTFRCVNSIFANNEAMLGDWSDHMWTTNDSGKTPAKGWTKQGFGGAIWGGENSQVRILNCDIVMNQAVSYPGVYINNSTDYTTNRFCANTVYWGNKTTGVPSSATGFSTIASSIDDINDDVFSYRTKAEKEGTQTAELNSRQPMFFCAYRPGFGPEPELSTGNINYDSNDYDPHAVPFLGESTNYYNLFGGNNNINITFANEGADGPNFLLPSTTPGKDGYNPAANWMPSRVNNLTDNGWSYLVMTSKTSSGDIEFKRAGANSLNEGGTAPENLLTPDNVVSGGPYNFYSNMLKQRFNLTLMPFGDQYYMKFRNQNMTDGNKDMLRISSNPLTFEEANAYIDIGVYEYQHRNLRINQNSEIDIIWVTEQEDAELGNDGYTWQTATSNLQAAIETLLRSRNDHAKQINIIEGEYKPSVILGDSRNLSLSFTIQTRLYNNAAFTPNTGKDYGIRSFTMKGGYDKDMPDETGYDLNRNVVKLSIEKRASTSDDQLDHIVNILDVEQYTTNVNSIGGNIEHIARGTAIPITFDGITFENKLAGPITSSNNGGAAIFYREQYQSNAAGTEKTTNLLKPPTSYSTTTSIVEGNPVEQLTWDWTTPSGQPKLTIRNCTFLYNGKEVTDPTSAVKIEGGGGSSLIVNSLFHHNEGNPVEAVNTTVLNSTFGLNKGHLTLTETEELGTQYHSEIHNTVIWRDDQANAQATQYSGATPGQYMTYNAITGFSATPDANQNYGISDTNGDVLKGPNFVDPTDGDFHLRPSKLLMNTGLNSTYAHFVWPNYPAVADYDKLMRNKHDDQDTWETRRTVIQNGNHTVTIEYQILKAQKDYALGFTERLLGAHIDRGAYECASNGQRVIYMNPNKTTNTVPETGRTWEEAYIQGHLQTAIDAATIYDGEGMAYVFVKGQSNANTEDAVTMHDGVCVYGSILPNYIEQAIPINSSSEILEYTNEELDAFVNRIKSERRGLASKDATPTRILGITTVEEGYTKGSLMDGFLISNRATSSNPATSPAVNITVPNRVLKNCLITDNVMNSGIPVVNIDNTTGIAGNSLLYNGLLYDNTAEALVNVATNGYMLNCTLVGNNDNMITGTAANASNIITANEANGKAATFAPYLRPNANAYSPANYLTTHQPYWYQLHEESTDIDSGTDNGAGADGGNSIAALFPNHVDFTQDLDVLGNPRRLGDKVDNGCYETWKIADGTSIEVNATTNPKAEADMGKYVSTYTSDQAPSFDDIWMIVKDNYWNLNYCGHFYPQQGSVVYIGQGSSLVLKAPEGDVKEFNISNPVRPGYLLVKDGGSVFGQGNWLQAEYLAAERNYTGLQYALTAFPFPYDIRNVISVSYNSGTLTETSEAANIAGQTYDVESRSVWRYAFQPENSTLWTDISGDACKIAANAGWLLNLGSSKPNKTLRFTGWGESSGQYPYVENGNNKTITLTQHNSTPGGGSAQFTALEDMGWNLFGMPWLVSNFKTDTQTAGKYAMHIPHVFYTMNGDAQYTRMTGQIYSSQSWASGATFNLGDANFTQTAVIGAEEPLTFFTPMYANYTSSSPSPHYVGIYMEDDDLESMDVVSIFPEDDADEAMPYRLNNDGIKLGTPDETLPQLFVSNAAGTRLSLVSKAPEETDISLGYVAPKEGIYTIALPEPDAYSDYEGVWLTDHETGTITNLLTDEYKLNANTTGENVVRLTIRFGSNSGSITTATTTGPYIYVKGRTLHADNLQEGDMVAVYTTAGALIDRTAATGNSYECKVEPGIYILKVNNTAKTLKAQ